MSETHAPTIPAATTSRGARRPIRAFLLHLGEMALAMTAGMLLFDPPLRLAIGAAATTSFVERADVAAAAMATGMAAGMVIWMAYRRHSPAAIAEMSLAMYVAYAGPLAAYWGGLMSGDAALAAGHVLMVPAMVMAMLRRRGEYAHGRHHRRHA